MEKSLILMTLNKANFILPVVFLTAAVNIFKISSLKFYNNIDLIINNYYRTKHEQNLMNI